MITITARVLTKNSTKASNSKNKRLSRRQLFAHGSIDIYDLLAGTDTLPETNNIACAFTDQSTSPFWFNRGHYVQLTGHFTELTKKTKLFNIDTEKSFLLSPPAVEKLLTTRGINANHERKQALEKGHTNLIDSINNGDASLELKEVYSQDVACLHNLLYDAGFQYDIEMSYQISTYFSRRAKIRGYTSVSAMIIENPWLLSELNEFKLADVKKAIEKLTPRLNKEVPIYAEMTSLVTASSKQGNSYVPLSYLSYKLMTKTLSSIGINRKEYSYFLTNLAQTLPERMPHRSLSRLVVSGSSEFPEETADYYTKHCTQLGIEAPGSIGKQPSLGIYLAKAYFSEKDSAEILSDMIGYAPLNYHSEDLSKFKELNPKQQTAIKNVLDYRVSALIGYAGTGKTHTMSRLLEILQKNDHSAIVLAPSAVAAQIAASKTKSQANYSTIHRFAHIRPESEDMGEYGEKLTTNHQNNYDVIIVDETTMCDITTFSALLHSIKDNPSIHLVLVGDTAQLPSIGPSGFFQQIASGALIPNGLPVTKLTDLYRGKNEELSEFTSAIRQGIYPNGPFDSITQDQLTSTAILTTAKNFIQKGIPFSDILFLTPTKGGEFGTDKLNRLLRPIFLANQLHIANLPICLGDPVISIKNDYVDIKTNSKNFLQKIRHEGRNTDIYNGTRGTITAYHPELNTVVIEYNTPDGQITIPYTTDELLAWIDVAYALTVHKAQGSEANHVVFIKPEKVLSRNMIYTATTRARETLLLLGKDFEAAVAKQKIDPYSKFLFRVQSHLKKKDLENSSLPSSLITEKSLFK